MKTHKRTKKSRQRGETSHGWGARQRHRGSGCKGGVGMSGSGKKASQKCQFALMHANRAGFEKYFGKKGFTSRRMQKSKLHAINLLEISKRFDITKKIELKDHKILGEGEGFKGTIVAKSASKSAIDKMHKAGGKIEIKIWEEKEVPVKEDFEKKKKEGKK